MKTTVCNFVFSFVLLLGGLVSNDVCAGGAERKENEKVYPDFVTSLAFNKAGKLYIAGGNTIREAGTGKVVKHDSSKVSFLSCGKSGFTFCNEKKLVQVSKEGKQKEREYSSTIVSVNHYPDGTPFINATARAGSIYYIPTGDPYEFMSLPQRVLTMNSSDSSAHPDEEMFFLGTGRANTKGGTHNRKSAYPVMMGGIHNASIICGGSGLVLVSEKAKKSPPHSLPQQKLWELKDNEKLIDYGYAPGWVSMLTESAINVRRMNESTNDWSQVLGSSCVSLNLRGHSYNRIELNGGGGLVAIKKQGGADFYSIQNGWLGEETLVKRPIGIEDRITGFAATPSGKTALATKRGVTEFDSQTGETINEYGLDGKLTSHNWWRTVRRNVLMPVLGGAAVAGAVVAYSHFQGKK